MDSAPFNVILRGGFGLRPVVHALAQAVELGEPPMRVTSMLSTVGECTG